MGYTLLSEIDWGPGKGLQELLKQPQDKAAASGVVEPHAGELVLVVQIAQ
ncbi:MAG: hypothetical protein ACYDAQ_00710 [Mycobacteriales bacterium]